MAEKSVDILTVEVKREFSMSLPSGLLKPKIHPAEDKYSIHIKKGMWSNPSMYFVLPLEVHVNATQERYGKAYPEFKEMGVC